MRQAQTRNRNIQMMYIDYKKAFDSVPHSWLIYIYIRILQNSPQPDIIPRSNDGSLENKIKTIEQHFIDYSAD